MITNNTPIIQALSRITGVKTNVVYNWFWRNKKNPSDRKDTMEFVGRHSVPKIWKDIRKYYI